MGEMAQLVPAGQMNGLTAYNSPTSKNWSGWLKWSN